MMSELHAEMQGQHDDAECFAYHQRSRAEEVVDEIACFIREGVLTEEEAIKVIQEAGNVRSTQ